MPRFTLSIANPCFVLFNSCARAQMARYGKKYQRFLLMFSFFFFFFKERLGLKLTHKRITTKVVLPASKGKGAIQGEVKMLMC